MHFSYKTRENGQANENILLQNIDHNVPGTESLASNCEFVN